MSSCNYIVYITTKPRKTTLYTGVTNDLPRRLQEHFVNSGNASTFAGKYYCYNPVYYHAIEREKEIKKWNHSKKESLITRFNPCWKFLNLEVQVE
ncbi:GIY-YIG nuclease family protein [Pontibacter korlensis]|uniref:GIY-YIG nuclease family protein n=1 Tax=Pontibacter korlensis TaxID=400092 RepID=UPI0008FF871A|nr:GIY-YIG nuclease family protein [Pontibacter korlensis]